MPLGNTIVLGNWEFRNTVCEMLVEAPAARRRSWDCRCGGKVATTRRLDMLATISTGGTRSLSPETSIATSCAPRCAPATMWAAMATSVFFSSRFTYEV